MQQLLIKSKLLREVILAQGITPRNPTDLAPQRIVEDTTLREMTRRLCVVGQAVPQEAGKVEEAKDNSLFGEVQTEEDSTSLPWVVNRLVYLVPSPVIKGVEA